MTRSLKQLLLAVASMPLLAIATLRATPVDLQEVGLGAHEEGVQYYSDPTPFPDNNPFNTATVKAGVIDLLVNGVATEAFCIEPFQASLSGTSGYDFATLASAPDPLGPMGDTAAKKIEQLWAKYYSPSISNADAAALQIAIWETVDAAVSGGTFTLLSNDYGASVMLAWVNDAANANAATADLTALVNSQGQDYVVQNVPDGGTSVALLGLSFVGLIALRRKFRAA